MDRWTGGWAESIRRFDFNNCVYILVALGTENVNQLPYSEFSNDVYMYIFGDFEHYNILVVV